MKLRQIERFLQARLVRDAVPCSVPEYREVVEGMEQLSTGELIAMLRRLADIYYDGHYTILSFTSTYRVGFGTPSSRFDMEAGPASPSLRTAIIKALLDGTVLHDDDGEIERVFLEGIEADILSGAIPTPGPGVI